MKEAGGAAMMWRGFAVQRRVIGALLIREIYSRFGRESLGFVWVVAEPLVFAVPVLLMWRAIRGSHEHGISVMPFLWSGYLPMATQAIPPSSSECCSACG